MLSDPAKPVTGVKGIWLDAVRNAVPIAAFRRVDVLTNIMAGIPTVQQQKQSAEGGFRMARSWKKLRNWNRAQLLRFTTFVLLPRTSQWQNSIRLFPQNSFDRFGKSSCDLQHSVIVALSSWRTLALHWG